MILRPSFIASSLVSIFAASSLYGAEPQAAAVARGAAVYARPGMCIACHQADGNGLPGAFPPLAGSDWVMGDPAALIRMIEQGIEGEITVNGKIYNAVMPAQGGQLSTKELADVLTYIRNSWGNKADPVTAKDVEEQRQIDRDRGEKPWTESELKTMATPKGLEHPTVQIYPGTWSQIPDLTQLAAPTATLTGLLGNSLLPKEGGLAVAEGILTAPKNGEAAITLRANGPAQVWLDDVLVVQTPVVVGWNGPAVVTRVNAVATTAGPRRFRIIALARATGGMQVAAAVNLPGFAKAISLTDGKAEAIAVERGEPGLDLEPAKSGTTLLYRGVFPGTSNRSIAVGFPERQSLMFDTINATWTMVWNGGFMTGRHHWSGRGMGYREWPLGDQMGLLPGEPPLAVLGKADSPWPGKCDTDVWPTGYQFLGYDLDKAQRPTFRYQAAGAVVTDRPQVLAPGLRRTLVINAPKAIPGLTFRPIAGKELVQVDSSTFRIANRLVVKLGLPNGATARTRAAKDDLTEVLVALPLTGKDLTLTVDYFWEDGK